jgi:hypothetical protein
MVVIRSMAAVASQRELATVPHPMHTDHQMRRKSCSGKATKYGFEKACPPAAAAFERGQLIAWDRAGAVESRSIPTCFGILVAVGSHFRLNFSSQELFGLRLLLCCQLSLLALLLPDGDLTGL